MIISTYCESLEVIGLKLVLTVYSSDTNTNALLSFDLEAHSAQEVNVVQVPHSNLINITRITTSRRSNSTRVHRKIVDVGEFVEILMDTSDQKNPIIP